MGGVLPSALLAQTAPAPAAPVAPAAPSAPAPAPAVVPVAGVVAATPLPTMSGSDMVGPVILRDDSVAQVLDLLQRWTGKSVLRPAALPGNLYTLTLPATITRDEALLALETLLNLNGIAVIQQGEKFLKVVPNGVAKSESPSLLTESALKLPPSGRLASRIFVLRHANAQEMMGQISGLLNPTLGSPPVFFGRNNALLITDSITNLQKIETVIAQLDRPQFDVITTKFYPLRNATAADLVSKLTALLRMPASTGLAPFRLSTGTSFTADERTNRVILMGSPDQHDFFDKLIATLDDASNPNTKTEVVFLRNADAQQVATLIAQLVTGQVAASTRANGQRNRTQAGAFQPGQAQGQPGQAQGAPGGQFAAAAGAQAGASEFSSTMTVLADIRSNSLVASGTPDDLRLLRDIVERVDIVLPQVRVEVVIAEVTLSDNESNGISALGLTVTNGKLTNVGGTFSGGTVSGINGANGSAVLNTPGGLAANGNLSAVIGLSTTPRKGDTKILSVPAVTTSHNKEATIFSGESRPVVTGSTQATTGQITSTVSQRDIGIQLKVLPLIGKDGSVQLQVSQSVEDILGSVQLDGNEQPVIGRRTTDSFVSAKSGEIIVLGGLQRTIKTKDTSRLGPIPFLGDLFGSSTSKETRQDLVIFLRPYVLTNTSADNAEALGRAQGGAIGEDVKKVVNRVPGATPSQP